MKVAATIENVTNSVCQMDDCPSTARTNTIWHTTSTDSRIRPVAATPNQREAACTAATQTGSGAVLLDTHRLLDEFLAAGHLVGESLVRRLLRHRAPRISLCCGQR